MDVGVRLEFQGLGSCASTPLLAWILFRVCGLGVRGVLEFQG